MHGLISHYTSADTFLNYIAPTQSLRLSPLKFVNDPAESFSWEFNSAFSGTLRHPIRKMNVFQKTSKNFFQENIKIGCFCEPEDSDDIFLKPRMWATYGARNRGVNLIFDKDLLTRTVQATFPIGRCWCNKVHYSQRVFAEDVQDIMGKHVDLDRLREVDARTLLLTMVEENWVRYFFHKHKDWRDENEYRVAVLDENNEFSFVPITTELVAIVLGAAFDRRLIPEVVAARSLFESPPELHLVTQSSDGFYHLVPAVFYSHPSIAEEFILPTERRAMATFMRSFL